MYGCATVAIENNDLMVSHFTLASSLDIDPLLEQVALTTIADIART